MPTDADSTYSGLLAITPASKFFAIESVELRGYLLKADSSISNMHYLPSGANDGMWAQRYEFVQKNITDASEIAALGNEFKFYREAASHAAIRNLTVNASPYVDQVWFGGPSNYGIMSASSDEFVIDIEYGPPTNNSSGSNSGLLGVQSYNGSYYLSIRKDLEGSVVTINSDSSVSGAPTNVRFKIIWF